MLDIDLFLASFFLCDGNLYPVENAVTWFLPMFFLLNGFISYNESFFMYNLSPFFRGFRHTKGRSMNVLNFSKFCN